MIKKHWTVPERLTAGARVALVSPSGPLNDATELDQAVANARSLGWEPMVGVNAMAAEGYFAGSDSQRAADVNWALSNPKVDGIWFLRGGYGSMRILNALDLSPLRHRPRAVIGYSDITAVHAAVGRSCELISFHGPTARTPLTPFTRGSLISAVSSGAESCGDANSAKVLRAGAAEGRILGGNLALLASLVGTPFGQTFQNAVVVLEDINEPVYRVDRMLQQLLLSGSLQGCRAIVFGHCTACSEEFGPGSAQDQVGRTSGGQRRGRTLEAVLLELAEGLKVPCVSGVPLGHIDDQWTLPLGVLGQLHAEAAGGVVRLSTIN